MEYGKLFYRNLERQKIKALAKNNGNFDSNLIVSNDIKVELNWWINNLKTQKRDIYKPPITCTITSDASESGWGATCSTCEHKIGGRFCEQEIKFHINYKELLAAFLGLKSFCNSLRDAHIRIMMDNTSAISFVNNMGSIKSISSDMLVKQIWQWAIDRNIWLSAAYIPGKLNIEADFYSRNFQDKLEWMIDRDVFKRICYIYKKPDIDLFASRLNYQLQKYVSWKPDPEASFIDAFSIDWGKIYFYAFPPFSLVGHCVQKIVKEKARGILIAPLWTTQAWFTQCLKLMVAEPTALQISHPLGKLKLVIFKLSGRQSETKAFLNQQPMLSSHHLALEPKNNTVHIIKDGKNFVINGRLIQLNQL